MSDEQTQHPDGAEYNFTDAEIAAGADSTEQVTTTVQDLQVLYYDAFQSGIMSAMVNFGHFPPEIATVAAQQITSVSRDSEEFVSNVRKSINDRLSRTNLDTEYDSLVVVPDKNA